jgi:DNA polymerase III alpha subunit
LIHLEYGLLFSRFLNKGRLGKSLPDIDWILLVKEGMKLKRYMESKYGNDYVTAIGTYGTFKANVEHVLKTLAREKGIDYAVKQTLLHLTSKS